MKIIKWLMHITLVFVIVGAVLGMGGVRSAQAEDEKSVWDKADEMLEEGEYKEAVSLYTIAVELNQGHPDLYLAYFNRAHALISLERFEDAESDLDTTIELAPNFPDAYKLQGILKLSLGYFEEAITDFDTLIELTPEDPYAYANRGTALSYLGLFDRALADFNTSIELDDTCAECYYNRAQLLILMDRGDDAQNDLNRAGDLDSRYRNQGEY
ncbi:MAG: tetratricopeptide repeat protein [Deltaproteobacteria bacterium]|nr:tetratricopeptide repeat protein [Candidatus Zymogenaceae bacterium]